MTVCTAAGCRCDYLWRWRLVKILRVASRGLVPRETEEYPPRLTAGWYGSNVLRQVRRGRVVVGLLGAITLVVVIAALRASATPAAPGAAPCNLVPQLRDVTINQGLGGYSPLVNGKETLVRFYLSLPSCAGSGPSIQIVGGTLTLSGGASGTIAAPTPVPTAPAYPVIATYGVAPVADSTGDPRFVVPVPCCRRPRRSERTSRRP